MFAYVRVVGKFPYTVQLVLLAFSWIEGKWRIGEESAIKAKYNPDIVCCLAKLYKSNILKASRSEHLHIESMKKPHNWSNARITISSEEAYQDKTIWLKMISR